MTDQERLVWARVYAAVMAQDGWASSDEQAASARRHAMKAVYAFREDTK